MLKSKSGDYVSVFGKGLYTEGAYGMRGVGKNIAMEGLCKDDELRETFKDGVCFVRLGNDVTENMFLRKIAACVNNYGGKKLAKEIIDQKYEDSNLERAVEEGGKWFQGRNVLLVCDDVCPSKTNEIVYRGYMGRLISRSPESTRFFYSE